jgi:hypothetical protein
LGTNSCIATNTHLSRGHNSQLTKREAIIFFVSLPFLFGRFARGFRFCNMKRKKVKSTLKGVHAPSPSSSPSHFFTEKVLKTTRTSVLCLDVCVCVCMFYFFAAVHTNYARPALFPFSTLLEVSARYTIFFFFVQQGGAARTSSLSDRVSE